MNWDEFFSHVEQYDPTAAKPPALPGGGGVYLLTDEQDRLVQLASAADLKRAILNRLASPETQTAEGSPPPEAPAPDYQAAPELGESGQESVVPRSQTAQEKAVPKPTARRRADLSQIVRHIRWQPAHSAFEITYQYWRISRVLTPDTYLKNLAFGPAWFVHVDPAATIPRFTVGKVVSSAPGTVLGPFSTQQDANRFVQILEDAFDLCRYIHILEQAPHGQPCAYHEMGRCPAPCGGLIPMEQYRETVAQAVRFAAGQRESARNEWDEQMRSAARELAFERAAAIKQRIERARELDHAAFRYIRPIETFSWLIVQRGGGRTRVKAFFVQAGRLLDGPTAKLKELDQVLPAWLEPLRDTGPDRQTLNPTQLQELSEHVWLVSHFLFRREQIGLFLDATALPNPTELAERIREHFSAAQTETASPDGLATQEPAQ